MLEVKDEKGKVYRFEEPEADTLVLHAVRKDVIIASFLYFEGGPNICTFSLDGKNLSNMQNDINDLVPYDEFKDIRQAYKEGAIVHFRTNAATVMLDADLDCGKRSDYFIKGNISIAGWNAHRPNILKWWDGKHRVFVFRDGEWEGTNCPTWAPKETYRTKLVVTQMTIKELEDTYGIENLEIIGEGK